MKIKWLGLVGAVPLLVACNSDIELSSSVLSNDQINTIINNVNKHYPDADSELKQNIAKVAAKSIENMLFIEGGSFVMGDFRMPCMNDDLNRPVWTPEASCYSAVEMVSSGADIQHEVTLSSYSLSKYETELLDYDVYLQAFNRPFEQSEDKGKYLERRSQDYQTYLPYFTSKPAREVNWQDAKNYCQWLGQLTALPVDLPTEAQWEYAARSRGQKLYYATNNGFKQYRGGGYYDPELGRYEEFTDKTANMTTGLNPVGTFAPNPLGLYDMTGNATEWVNDWYAKGYYKMSPKLDPQGPERGEYKVKRGGVGMVNVSRAYDTLRGDNLSYTSGFRCALQSTEQAY